MMLKLRNGCLFVWQITCLPWIIPYILPDNYGIKMQGIMRLTKCVVPFLNILILYLPTLHSIPATPALPTAPPRQSRTS